MLDDAYFKSLDECPSTRRLDSLPLWASRYERQLRTLASWWHEAKHAAPTFAAPVIEKPLSARWLSLPRWAQEWFNTLAFEVVWYRDQVKPPEPKPFESHRLHRGSRPRSLFAHSLSNQGDA